MAKLYLPVRCQATFDGVLDVPDDMTKKEALQYARDHMESVEILSGLKHIPGSDCLDFYNHDADVSRVWMKESEEADAPLGIYPTTAICPMCGKTILFTSDVHGKQLLCWECDETFDDGDVLEFDSERFEVHVPLKQETYEALADELCAAAAQTEADSFWYDSYAEKFKVAFSEALPDGHSLQRIPDARALNRMCAEIRRICL